MGAGTQAHCLTGQQSVTFREVYAYQIELDVVQCLALAEVVVVCSCEQS